MTLNPGSCGVSNLTARALSGASFPEWYMAIPKSVSGSLGKPPHRGELEWAGVPVVDVGNAGNSPDTLPREVTPVRRENGNRTCEVIVH